jgi:hypothetical protein
MPLGSLKFFQSKFDWNGFQIKVIIGSFVIETVITWKKSPSYSGFWFSFDETSVSVPNDVSLLI